MAPPALSPLAMAAGSTLLLVPRQDAPPPTVGGNGTAPVDSVDTEPLAGRIMSVILALVSVSVLSVFISQ